MKPEQILDKLKEQKGALVGMLNAGQISPTALSELALKMAVVNDMLTDQITAARTVLMAKEAEWRTHFLKEGFPKSAISDEVRVKVKDERITHDHLEASQRSMWRVLDMARTHISAYKVERENS